MNTMQDKGWNAMKHMLDEHMPVQKKPLWRRLTPLVLLLMALSISGVIYLSQHQFDTFDMISAYQAPQNAIHNNTSPGAIQVAESALSEALSTSAALTTDLKAEESPENTSVSGRQQQSPPTRQNDEPSLLQNRNAAQNAPHTETKPDPKETEKTWAAEEENPVIALRPEEATSPEDISLLASTALITTLQPAHFPLQTDLTAPLAPDILPIAQNIFQLRAHGNLIGLPGQGIHGGSAGLSGRLAISKKAGLIAGASLGYVRPQSPILESPGLSSQTIQLESQGVIYPENYTSIRHYWHAHYSARAVYRPWSPIEFQLGMFHLSRLNQPEHNRVFITDHTDPADDPQPQDNWRDFHPSFTGLQTGLSLQITPRWSVEGQYLLGFKKWLTPSPELGKGPHMQLFTAGVAYRIL